jgi:hypothetical protein
MPEYSRKGTIRPAREFVLALLVIVAASGMSSAQDQTVGLFEYDYTRACPGYTLFNPNANLNTYLIDMWGRVVHTWTTGYQPAMGPYLLEDGDLLIPGKLTAGGGAGGIVQRYSWDGTLEWEFEYFTADLLPHHDIAPLPNGNVLILAWEDKDASEAIAQGRDPAFITVGVVSPEHVIEVEPVGSSGGNIVWAWHAWDHLIQDFDSTKPNYGVVADHPELFDLNFGNPDNDWMHGNAIDYNPELDQIIISSLAFKEFWVIDHSTTTAEAAGHTGGNSGMGGDILYRWGNPQAYDRGDAGDQQLFNQHDAHWVDNGLPGGGNILVFNNRVPDPGGEYSSVDEIVPPVDGLGHYTMPPPGEPYGPAAPVWRYIADPPQDFYGQSVSGSRRLDNGNTLMCAGPDGIFIETTPDLEVVWKYINPSNINGVVDQGEYPGTNRVFRCYRYPADYPAFAGRSLLPGAALERYPVTISGTQHSPAEPQVGDSIIVTTTITSDGSITATDLHYDDGGGFAAVPLFDDGNHHDGAASDGLYGASLPPLTEPDTVEYYIQAEDDADSVVTDPPNPPSTVYFYAASCACPYQGDADEDGFITALDMSDLIDILFAGAEDIQDAACPVSRFDLDCDSFPTALDLSKMIDYLFASGPGPCEPCAL